MGRHDVENVISTVHRPRQIPAYLTLVEKPEGIRNELAILLTVNLDEAVYIVIHGYAAVPAMIW
jgi:hypothetical protein